MYDAHSEYSYKGWNSENLQEYTPLLLSRASNSGKISLNIFKDFSSIRWVFIFLFGLINLCLKDSGVCIRVENEVKADFIIDI